MTFIITEADKKYLRRAKGPMLAGHITFLALQNKVSVEEAKKEVELFLHPPVSIPKGPQLVETLPVAKQAVILPPKRDLKIIDEAPLSNEEIEARNRQHLANHYNVHDNRPVHLVTPDHEKGEEVTSNDDTSNTNNDDNDGDDELDDDFEEDLEEQPDDLAEGDTEPPQSMAAPKKDKKSKKQKKHK